MINRLAGTLIATWLVVSNPEERDERGGGSGTIEMLLIIAGVIAIVAVAIFAIKTYVSGHLPT